MPPTGRRDARNLGAGDFCPVTAPPTRRRGALELRPRRGVVGRGVRRAGSCGRWRLRVDLVSAGRFLADTGFPRLWPGLGCSCSPGPRVLKGAGAGGGQFVPGRSFHRDPDSRASRQARRPHARPSARTPFPAAPRDDCPYLARYWSLGPHLGVMLLAVRLRFHLECLVSFSSGTVH